MKHEIGRIVSIFQMNLPDAKIELNYSNTFELLIAVMLSAQSTDVAVNKVTPALFRAAATASKMVDLGVDKIKEHIRTIGLSNTKANNIFKTSVILQKKYSGDVPEDREALESLPGVGRKTANVVLSEAFGWDCIAVDTHVFRVNQRIGLVPKINDRLKLELALTKVVPKKWQRQFHHWLIHLGRSFCKARNPDCQNCFLKEKCIFYVTSS